MYNKVCNCKLKDVKILKPNIFEDERGLFFEAYNKKLFDKTVAKVKFVQDNESHSTYGTVRGLHFQVGKYAQAKLVRVIKGEIKDIIIDLRVESPTYMEMFSIILSEENKKQLFVPRGFAHGFSVLSKEAIVQYKTDNFYNKESERCINPLSKDLFIDWEIKDDKIIMSEKDKLGLEYLTFEDCSDLFVEKNLVFKK